MKRSQESSSLNFLWRWKQAHVVLSRGTAYLWDKILQVSLKIRGVRDTLKCELGKKEVWTPNVVLISELRESRVTCGSEDSGDLSLKDACLGKPRSMNKRSFIPSNVDSRWKSDNGKGMKGGHKEGTQKTKGKESPLCCIDGHPPHSKLQVHPGECSQEQSQVWNLWEFLIWDNHWRSGWRLPSMKSYENEFKIILQYKYHHWVFWNILSESWQVVNYELRFTVAQKEENFDNLCCESSQPTVEHHEWGSQDSNNVDTKMNLQACIGKPLPSRCGWNPASSKSSRGSSGGSSNPMSIHSRTKSNYGTEKDPSRAQN